MENEPQNELILYMFDTMSYLDFYEHELKGT